MLRPPGPPDDTTVRGPATHVIVAMPSATPAQRRRAFDLAAGTGLPMLTVPSAEDMGRQGDLDGRGNLSERMLRQWCHFFIELCEDQVGFMTKMLDLAQLRQRIAGLVLVRSQSTDYPDYRKEAVLPLHHELGVPSLGCTPAELLADADTTVGCSTRVHDRLSCDGVKAATFCDLCLR